MSTHEPRSDVGAYLLGELSERERGAFERAMAGDAALRAEVERLRPVVARLDALPAEAWDDEPAPPLRLPADALVDPVPVSETGARAAAAPARRRRWWAGPLTLRPAFAALAAAALLAGGIAIGALVDDGDSTSSPPAVQAQRPLSLQPIGDGTAAARGTVLVPVSGGQGQVTLRVRGLPPNRAGQLYELWLMDADGPLVSLGSFRVGAGGRATVRMPLPVPATRYQYFDVSVEPEGADAGHSGDSVLRGATSA
jgi:anti-sigma-K factor RskA